VRSAGTLAIAVGLCAVNTGVAAAAGPDPQGTVYVADYATNAIDVFAPGSNGNVAPERVISGPDTGINGPGDVKVDPAGDVWVSNFNSDSLTEYAPGASGDATPTCTIQGANTGLDENDDVSLLPDGTVVVGNFSDSTYGTGSVEVFAPGSCGNVTPNEVISDRTLGSTSSTASAPTRTERSTRTAAMATPSRSSHRGAMEMSHRSGRSRDRTQGWTPRTT
jgi:hypothetical protein